VSLKAHKLQALRFAAERLFNVISSGDSATRRWTSNIGHFPQRRTTFYPGRLIE
jgi:hypothetical protein